MSTVPADLRSAAFATAYRVLGGPPARLGWSGSIEGTLVWRSFNRGSTGRLELNHLVRGHWQHEGSSRLQVQWPAEIPAPNASRPILTLCRTEQFAKSAILRAGAYRSRVSDIGDEAFGAEDQMVIRHGRWIIDMKYPPGAALRPATPEQFRATFEEIRRFIDENNLESLLSAHTD